MSNGPFIETRSGARFTPLAPRAADVQIEDIAHALSNQCRFSGHTRVHYSVAEHSVRVARLLAAGFTPNFKDIRGHLYDFYLSQSVEVQLWGLLHDASEAYLVDLPQPLKADPRIGEPYRAAEQAVMAVICQRFGLAPEQPRAVTIADGLLLATEARDLMPYRTEHWDKLKHYPLPEEITPWGPAEARRRFLETFKTLSVRRFKGER